MATVVDIFEINVQPIAEQLSALGAQIDSAKKKYAELKQTQGEYAELDALIRKAERKKIAVMVLQGLIARNDEGVGDLLMDAPFYAIDIACALLSELEPDKSEQS